MIPAHSSGAASWEEKFSGIAIRVRLVDDRGFGEAAVGVPAGEAGGQAQILLLASAESAFAAGVPQPRDADPGAEVEALRALAALVDDADDLMAGHDRLLVQRKVAFGDVQIGSADAAGLDGHADLTRPGLRRFDLDRAQQARCRRALLHDLPGVHQPDRRRELLDGLA